MEIEGWAEIFEALDKMDNQLQNQIIRGVHRSIANKTIKKEMQAALPYTTGIKKGIGVKSVRGNKTAIWVGANTDAFYLRFLEFGTRVRETASFKGKPMKLNRGRISSRPILVRMVDRSIERYINELNQGYGEELKKWMERKLKSTSRRLQKLADK